VITNLARVGVAMTLVVASATARADGDADRAVAQSTAAANAGDAAAVAVPVLPPLPAAYEPPPRARRERRRPPRGKRYNTGMMVGGIVLAASSPIVGLVAGLLAHESGARGDAPVAVGLTTFLIMAGAGIPLAVIGGRRVPTEQREEEARVRFVLGPHGAFVTGSF
jgi:hypothetical protein